MLTFKVDVVGGFSADAFTDKVDAAVETALDKSAAAILNRLRASFLAETTPSGEKWVQSFSAIRRRKKGGTGTLFDTGRLFRSIQLFKSEKGQRAIGTDVPYGVKHQEGLDGMVKRVFLGFTDEHTTLATAIFVNELKKVKV